MVAKAVAEEGVATTTPSGIEVYYSWAPKRLYRVRQAERDFEIIPAEAGGDPRPAHLDATEWVEVPSVTTVLDVLDKPGLPWWGMRVGIEGVLELHTRGLLREHRMPGYRAALICPGPLEKEGQAGMVVAGLDQVEKLLTKEKLTVNHVRDTAGDRGQAVHDALEIWAKEGTLPDPEMFAPEQQHYVRGLRNFLVDTNLVAEASEVMVGSLEHRYAGRYDLRGRIPRECRVVYKRTPKKGAHYASLAPGVLLCDLKTSSGVYESHSLQLEGYEQASIECGYEPTEARGVILVGADKEWDNDGEDPCYQFVRSTAEFIDFKAVLDLHFALERMKARKR